jgi:hypothetical protein
MTRCSIRVVLTMLLLFSCGAALAANSAAPLSAATEECLGCHATFHPGIVAEWQKSRHAAMTPGQALAVKGLARKISAASVPEQLSGTAVGCAECHTLRPESHSDSFEHNGHQVHVVVSPKDCAHCHPEEQAQFGENLMAHAHANLAGNALYGDLERAISGSSRVHAGKVEFSAPDADTRAVTCYYCHGTRLAVEGTETRSTDAGELEFPIINGWPNQGVGRINLDGSLGACSACHTRHAFSIVMARKPQTCKQCHAGPDVPAYKVFDTSKHGNLFSSFQSGWDFTAVPWTVGQDFTAPTCAVCHVSLVVTPEGSPLAQRSHRMNDRLAWRIFGLPYAHPHPVSPDVTAIRNKSGLPLPTDLDGTPASGYLIDAGEARQRTQTMQSICAACHDTSWVAGHWRRHEHTIHATNAETRSLTQLMQEIWRQGLAQGPAVGANPFDETPERLWSDGWLFFANQPRFAAAMAGGGDYAVFADGRYHLAQRIAALRDWLATPRRPAAAKTPAP